MTRIGSTWLTDKSAYDEWVEEQGIGRVVDYHIPDLMEVPLKPWERRGGNGVFLNLIGTEDTNDAYICEIPAGGSLKPERHLYEELVYVLAGRGATEVWSGGGKPVSFEWQAGSLFAIPLNASARHFNASGTQSARFLAVTSAPLMINLLNDLEFVFNCEHDFARRFGGDDDYFSGQGVMHGERVWESNFVSDVRTMKLVPRSSRGGDMNVQLELADGALASHISEMPAGRYKQAHRHGPGAHVIILSGKGYSLMWPDGGEPRRFDWRAGSMIVPPDMWWHQHFNTGPEPARYLALRWGSNKHHVFKRYTGDVSAREGGNQIDFADQDPSVHDDYASELARNGVPLALRPPTAG